MSSSKRPSTSSLRRFISSRPYVPVAEIRRRFGIDDPECMCALQRNGERAFVGLPDREALKLQDLWNRDEIGLELSVEVHARVVVGIYPMRIARYLTEANGHGNGFHPGGPHPGSNWPRPPGGPAGPYLRPTERMPAQGSMGSSPSVSLSARSEPSR